MANHEFKVGDRVTVNGRRVEYQGRQGTIKYSSGGQLWVLLDGDDEIKSGFQPWSLDRLSAEART
ncbi:MAG: hypothetical protein O3A93_12115 [Chloroflexi bacterium]|nr:hypothetical protein [Chloroflexota bacterium]MDA1271982.1 hypothetical protein [Chloroflexota bacterium]PKB58137.1 MAG: hypothetical protein BZY83_08780 [SAR202 cluster bacterium Casp-Chloro-G2]